MPHIAPGYRVGKLTVVASTDKTHARYRVWLCRCDCGQSIELDTRTLQRGTVTSCGCESNQHGRRDLTGMRFGKLLCQFPTEKRDKNGSVLWHCICDCGTECDAPSGQLLSGNQKSCGCLHRPPIKDYIGQRFGRLTVLAYAGKENGMHRWKCICDCGRESIVGQTLLQSGRTKSCGCLQSSMVLENLKIIDGTSIAMLEAGKKRRIATNTSGYTGVYQNKQTGKWVAQITFKGKRYYLGSYEKIEDAAKARQQGEEMHDEFLEWYYREREEAVETAMGDS